MAGLTHEQAKHFFNAATDKCLNPLDQAALEKHLRHCPNCRAYAAELDWLNQAIGRALRARWAAPRRAPIDMAARVRQHMRATAERQLFVGMAQMLVKLGSLAVVIMLAIGVLRNQTSASKQSSPIISAAAASQYSGLPSFEFESDSTAINLSVSNEGDRWELPALPTNRLHPLQY